MSDISTSNAENRGLLASGSNLIALISFLISIVGFFVPLIVAFGLLGRGTSATSAALGSVFSNRKNNNKNQILNFINRKRKLKRRKETKLRERAELPEYYEDEEYNNMAAKLHWINESFRRYEIEDLGCQLYIACEAGKIKGEQKSPKIGRITTMIHSMISPIQLSEVDRLPKDVKRLFLAYQEGSMLDETCTSLYSAICPLITKPDKF